MVEIVTETTGPHSQTIHRFENGYGVSIIEYINSGNIRYEIAILQYKSDELYELVYPEFTNGDIIKCNNMAEVNKFIKYVYCL